MSLKQIKNVVNNSLDGSVRKTLLLPKWLSVYNTGDNDHNEQWTRQAWHNLLRIKEKLFWSHIIPSHLISTVNPTWMIAFLILVIHSENHLGCRIATGLISASTPCTSPPNRFQYSSIPRNNWLDSFYVTFLCRNPLFRMLVFSCSGTETIHCIIMHGRGRRYYFRHLLQMSCRLWVLRFL